MKIKYIQVLYKLHEYIVTFCYTWNTVSYMESLTDNFAFSELMMSIFIFYV